MTDTAKELDSFPTIVTEEKNQIAAGSQSSGGLDSGEPVDRSYEKALLRKLDLRLLPILTLLYLLSFLDRSNG